MLLEEEVVHETLKRHSLSNAEKFIQEVYWRAYFKGWLEQRPSVWMDYNADLVRLIEDLQRFGDLRSRYEAAISGKTGIDCFDAWALELVETGYLHNHARMWFASIWIFTLHPPWQLGADFSYRHLLDGDPASNTLSWRWVGGLHTKGKTYIARKSNIQKYTDGCFSPEGLADDALPLLEDVNHSLKPLPVMVPLVLDEPFGLIVTEEDCSPETLPLAGKPNGVCGLHAKDGRSPLATGSLAVRFTEDSIKNALDRADKAFECETSHHSGPDWGAHLVEWAHGLGVKTLVTAFVPVGSVRDRLGDASRVLAQAGIKLLQVRRTYDSAVWPHASRGFFKLKAKIPQLVKSFPLA